MIRGVLAIAAVGATGCAQLIGFEDAGELRLANLQASTGVLVPAFDPEVASYAVALPYVGPGFALTASADPSVTLAIDGAPAQVGVPRMFDVPVGDRAIAISLRTTSGVERTYTVAVHRADLDLAFAAPTPVYGIDPVYAVQRADVNGDGVDDLIGTATDGSVGAFVDDGHGVFTTTSTWWLAGLNPRALAITDVSGDGIGDLVVANGALMIANGAGDGSFAAPAAFGGFSDASTFAIGRIDADAFDDLAVANGTGLVTPVFGRATGPVKGPDWPITQIVGEPSIVRIAKIDGPKLVSLDPTDHQIIVTATSDPSMRWPFPLDSLAFPRDLLVADFDGDGRDDIAFLDEVSGVVTVLTAFPTWTRTTIAVSGDPRALALGDLDGDGHVDLAMTAGNDLVVLRNDGTATFEQRRFANLVDTPSGLAIGDFNHDGRDDVIFAQGTSEMMMALGVHRE